MALTFVQSNSAQDDTNDTGVSVSLTGVGAGSLIVLFLKHEGDDTTYSGSDGTSSLTFGTAINHSNNDLSSVFGWLLSANSGNITYTVTLGAARAFKWLIAYEFSYSGTCSKDTENSTASGTAENAVSGSITTTGTDEVVLGGRGSFSSLTYSNHTINGVADDGTPVPGGSTAVQTWYRILTGTFSGGTAVVTGAPSGFAWTCNIIAFKVEAGGGGDRRFFLIKS